MDTARSTAIRRTVTLASFLILAGAIALAQTSHPSADDLYRLGLKYASEQNWPEANGALLRGRALFPSDGRFPTELAGVAFKEKKTDAAIRWLRTARKLKPDDSYTNDFLGTVYYLKGNVQAALNAWNRAGKPVLENVRTEPQPKLDPVILDRAFAFAPGEKLTLATLRTTETRLERLDLFRNSNLRLEAREDGRFDATLYASERDGFGRNKWEALFSTFQGAFAWTVTPTYYNLRGSGTNIATLIRFDPEKRRGTAELAGPLHRNPRWRYHLGGDFRNENWNVRNFSALPGSGLGSLNLRRTAASADIDSIPSGRWNWSLGGEYSYRDFRSVTGPEFPAPLLLKGSQLKQRAAVNYEIARLPERHLVITSSASSQLGRIWADGGKTFLKLNGAVQGDWFLKPSGTDLAMRERISAGRTQGDVPFDELYVMGLDRDDRTILMRGHFACDSARKGNAPLGRRYFVSNWELDKNVYSRWLLHITVGPFLDTGKITDPLPELGSKKWLWDTGAQAKFKAFGASLAVVYGKDLRTGNNTAYVYLTK